MSQAGKSNEPNPLLLGWCYFMMLILLIGVIVMACNGGFLIGRRPVIFLIFAANVYLLVIETRRYRDYSKRKKREWEQDMAFLESASINPATEAEEHAATDKEA